MKIIYAAAKPIEKYDVTLESGNTYGLYSTYGHYPPMLALIMITTPFGYDYEGGKDRGECRVVVTDVEPFIQTLEVEVGGKKIKDHLMSLNPLEFYTLINELTQEELQTIPIVTDAYKDDPETLRLVVGARAAAWAATYRGRINRVEGKVVQAAFGRGIPVPENLKLYDRHLKEVTLNSSK